jgi:hypothetical protein
MKKFLSSIPNKVKAIYLVWVGLQLFMYVASGNFLDFSPGYNASHNIFPFSNEVKLRFDLSYYDLSDFIFYLLTPVLLYYVFYLWKKPNGQNAPK